MNGASREVSLLVAKGTPYLGNESREVCSAVLKDGSAWTGEPYSQRNPLIRGSQSTSVLPLLSLLRFSRAQATEQASHVSVRTSPQPPLHLDIPPNTSTARGGRRRQGQGSTWIARSRNLPRWLRCSMDRVPSKSTSGTRAADVFSCLGGGLVAPTYG
jgi:hypothetical protein